MTWIPHRPVPWSTTNPSKWSAELRMSLAILVQATESMLEEPTRGSSMLFHRTSVEVIRQGMDMAHTKAHCQPTCRDTVSSSTHFSDRVLDLFHLSAKAKHGRDQGTFVGRLETGRDRLFLVGGELFRLAGRAEPCVVDGLRVGMRRYL